MKVMNGLDLQSQKITALADPSAATDAAKELAGTGGSDDAYRTSARKNSFASSRFFRLRPHKPGGTLVPSRSFERP